MKEEKKEEDVSKTHWVQQTSHFLPFHVKIILFTSHPCHSQANSVLTTLSLTLKEPVLPGCDEDEVTYCEFSMINW